MSKKILFTGSIVLLLSLASVLKLYAQYPVGVPMGGCKIWVKGTGWVEVPCNTPGSTGSDKSGKLNTSSPIVMGIMGAVFGGLGGSLYKGINGEYQATAGAELGYGVFSALTMLATAKKRSLGANIAIAVTSGAVMGLGVAGAEKAMAKTTSPEKPDNTVERVLEGAAATLVLEGLFTGFKKKTSGYISLNKKNNFLSNTYVSLSRDKIGIKVRF